MYNNKECPKSRRQLILPIERLYVRGGRMFLSLYGVDGRDMVFFCGKAISRIEQSEYVQTSRQTTMTKLLMVWLYGLYFDISPWNFLFQDMEHLKGTQSASFI